MRARCGKWNSMRRAEHHSREGRGRETRYIGTLSDVAEHRREPDHDYRRPDGIDRQVTRLPTFEARERAAPAQEADVEHGGPHQVDEQDHVLTQGGHTVGGEAEL